MDLIYTNANREDQGVLMDYEMDLAFGQDENNFECTISSASHCCEAGSFLYMEGTEYGGIVDSIQSKSADKEVVYSGRTWHGILGSKVILPLQAGETAPSGVTIKTTDSAGNSIVGRYLIISGDAHACMRFILGRIGLSDMYTAPTVSSGVNIAQYQFNRYTDAYNGIVRMLASAGQKLHVMYTGGMVVLSAAEKHDYSQDEEFDSSLVEYNVKKSYKTVNHLICLGTGELENRMVVHLYADANGNISRTQTQFGMDEYTATYEYPNVESEEELIKNGTEELQNLWEPDKLSVDLDERMDDYDVGDTVGTMDVITGMRISATITKKIITIKNGQINVDISTDNYSTSGSGASGDGAENSIIASDSEKLGGKAPEYYLQPRNLLDNSNFRNPVNQRGAIILTGVPYTYFIDRWDTGENTAVRLENKLLYVAGNLYQRIVFTDVSGKTLTFAVCDADGNSSVCTFSVPVEFEGWKTLGFAVTDYGYLNVFTTDVTADPQRVAFSFAANAEKAFKWAALYEGSYTADNLPPYVPKGYAAELAECQRYYYIHRLWVRACAKPNQTNVSHFNFQFPIIMRANPALQYDVVEGTQPTWIGANAYGIESWSDNGVYTLNNISATADL